MSNISRALEIDGWMTEKELTWLAEQASTHQAILEIGSYKGRSTRAMADNLMPEGSIVCIDPWDFSPADWMDPVTWTKAELQPLTPAQSIKLFVDNLQPHISSGQVFPSRGTSESVLTASNFDLIFIDARHDYVSVQHDIRKWRQKMNPGGILSGHDYSPDSHYWPGVKRAVDEAFGDAVNLVPDTSIWYVQL